MIAVAAYALLIVITILFVMMVRSLYRRTGDVSILVGAAILYLWTFLGAWFFIGDAASGFKGNHIGLSYYYLMEKMFPFGLDVDYMIQLGAYAVFTFVLLAVVHLFLPKVRPITTAPVALSREVLVTTGLLALGVSAWCIFPIVQRSMGEGRPLYLLVHEWTGLRRSLHAFSSSAACFAFVLGLSVHLGAGSTRAPFVELGRWLPRWSYLAGVMVMCVVLSLTGDRHTIFGALMLGMIYVLNVGGRAALRPAMLMLVGGGIAMIAGGALRGMAWTDNGPVSPEPANEQFHLPAIRHIPRHPSSMLGKMGERLLSNEMFCAHFSFYGILQRHVPPDPGISCRYLVHAFSPAAERPITVYDHYAASAQLMPGQGYTIHHASAWYLNAGWAGIPLGGAVLGAIWVLLMRMASARGRSGWPRLLPWLFVAFLPAVIRSGPESYKALVVEGLLFPLLTLAPALIMGGRLARNGTDHKAEPHA
jgi:hypothetical protein